MIGSRRESVPARCRKQTRSKGKKRQTDMVPAASLLLPPPAVPARLPAFVCRSVGRVGRADTMGLAISLVSTVPEKVRGHPLPAGGAQTRTLL